jgi:hypothetical protein
MTDNFDKNNTRNKKLIEALHKYETKLCNEIQSGIMEHEVAAVFTEDGLKIKDYEGTRSKIIIPYADYDLLRENIYTHCHFVNEILSPGDILAFSEIGLKEIRAIIKNGRYSSLRESSDKNAVQSNIGYVMKAEEVGTAKQAMAILMDLINDTGLEISGEEYQDKILEIRIEKVDEWLTENAESFGYIYAKGVI